MKLNQVYNHDSSQDKYWSKKKEKKIIDRKKRKIPYNHC
jgi:hypothetical protein